MNQFQKILQLYYDLAVPISIRKLGNGLINDTYLVSSGPPPSHNVVAQRINSKVFLSPPIVMANLRVLNDHYQKITHWDAVDETLIIPRIVKSSQGADFIIDEEGALWRVIEFIPETYSIDKIDFGQQASEIGTALGKFHRMVISIDQNRLSDPLPGFHDTRKYFTRLQRLVHDNYQPERFKKSKRTEYCIEKIRSYEPIVDILNSALQSGKIFMRPIHGDPKLNNFLFRQEHIVALIDLDTFGAGLIQHDIGDCLRSCCMSSGEDESQFEKIWFDLDRCRLILQAYFNQVGNDLSIQDRKFAWYGILSIPLELSIRFLSDYLNGSQYFKIDYPEQNLVRALAQLCLFEDILEKEESIVSMLV